MQKEGSLLLSDYAAEIAATDVLNPTDFSPVLQGLYGEIGGIMATAKKHIREKSAYPGFKESGRRRVWRHALYFWLRSAGACRFP